MNLLKVILICSILAMIVVLLATLVVYLCCIYDAYTSYNNHESELDRLENLLGFSFIFISLVVFIVVMTMCKFFI